MNDELNHPKNADKNYCISKRLLKFLIIILIFIILTFPLHIMFYRHYVQDQRWSNSLVITFDSNNTSDYSLIIPFPMTRSGSISSIYYERLRIYEGIGDFSINETSQGKGLRVSGNGTIIFKSQSHTGGSAPYSRLSMSNSTDDRLLFVYCDHLIEDSIIFIHIEVNSYSTSGVSHSIESYAHGIIRDEGWSKIDGLTESEVE